MECQEKGRIQVEIKKQGPDQFAESPLVNGKYIRSLVKDDEGYLIM